MREKWYFIVAAVLGVIWIIRGYFDEKQHDGLVEGFKERLEYYVRLKRKEAIDRAEKKHDNTVDSDLDDWLDDELGSD